ncbi:MAG: membrane protein [Minwuia thermotolerans]|nr:MAG: membrane protein [Minwuia thermotolerans]
MLDDFLVRALLGGVMVALVAGPLGCFVVWRRMAYFGDTMAHSALLGVSLGLLLSVQPVIGVAVVVVIAAFALFWLERFRWLASDTALGMLAHGSLAVGLVMASTVPGLRVDLMSYLFGDILAIGRQDLVWIAAGVAVTMLTLALIWRDLLAATVQADLAKAEGVPVARVRLIFALLVALLIAAAMKIVGILLVTAMLIIPAAAARRVSGSPEVMAVVAALLGMVSVAGGLGLSLWIDSPSGPSIVLAAIVLFVLLLAGTGLVAGGTDRRR